MEELVMKNGMSQEFNTRICGNGCVSWRAVHRCVCLCALVQITSVSAGVSGWVTPYDYNTRRATRAGSEAEEKNEEGPRGPESLGVSWDQLQRIRGATFFHGLDKTMGNKEDKQAHNSLFLCSVAKYYYC